jgi:hypothetical protein
MWSLAARYNYLDPAARSVPRYNYQSVCLGWDRTKVAYLMSPPIPHSETTMPHAIIRRENGRRHEVDFGDRPFASRFMPAKRPSRFSSRRIPRCSRRSVGASHFSIFLATCSAKPPPQRRDVPRIPSCILGVTSDVGTRAEFKSARFLVLVNPWHDLLAAASRGVSRPSRTPTGPPKHPRALPKGAPDLMDRFLDP